MKKESQKAPAKPNIFKILTPYRRMIFLLIFLALLSNGINLIIPRLISKGIDGYTHNTLVMKNLIFMFGAAALLIFFFNYLQTIVQTYTSEKVARDMREKLSDRISRQSHVYIQETNPAKLLTNLTSDIDSIKMFVSQAIVSIASSIVIIVGASILLIMINWKLALAVLMIIPIIGGAFFFVLKKVRPIFMKSRQVIDKLNKVINESILGAALIRVLNSQQNEYVKFIEANGEARDLGMSILRMFAGLIPVITFVANLAMLTILVLGGHFVINGSMTLGNFAAFNGYLSLLIFPILVIGFMSNVIAQASASYGRIAETLNSPDTEDTGTITAPLSGEIALKNVMLTYGEKPALKDVSIEVQPGSRTAIIGPTAAGKTQLLYLLTALIKPNEGQITFDNISVDDYNKQKFYSQVGFVFQDSIIFNMSIRENIAFSNTVTDEALEKAIETAELKTFIDSLPGQLDAVVSERGTSLSGGQKQRIMLARALAINPTILLLDDFTARVDSNTEKRILNNLRKNYPGLTLVSVTQKIDAVKDYDQIILLMEGEVIASGVHDELMHSSPEYVQIYESQKSTNVYEEPALASRDS
ncbi:ABC transporter ATP-binding protein [Chitinophagaceae bacterium 26-R-25]|nr:ABC transporter ATP-binding protein [Chitinophagaceae bacterium 26-R-25]